MLVYLDRNILPEVLVVVLSPKGNLQVDPFVEMQSRRGWTRQETNWRIVELWNLSAAELLAVDDPGLVPWIPLTKFEGPPEPVLQQCRQIIDRNARPEEVENLLAVTQILGSLRYNTELLMSLFGGKRPMIETPLLQQIVSEAEAKGEAVGEVKALKRVLVEILESRFDAIPVDLTLSLASIADLKKLEDLVRRAAQAKDLISFREHLRQ